MGQGSIFQNNPMKVCTNSEPCHCTDFSKKFCKWFAIPKKAKVTGFIKSKLNPVSEKRKVEGKEYITLRQVFLSNRPVCEFNLPGCTKVATDVHHRARRGKNYLNVKTWMSGCRHCHQYAETHPIESREKGWIIPTT
jgi:hypothetical protein